METLELVRLDGALALLILTVVLILGLNALGSLGLRLFTESKRRRREKVALEIYLVLLRNSGLAIDGQSGDKKWIPQLKEVEALMPFAFKLTNTLFDELSNPKRALPAQYRHGRRL